MADDMTDSGRHSPFMTPPIMQTSIAVPNAVLTDASDVIRGLSGALMILQQDFEQRKIQLALEEINTTLETDDEEGLIYLSDNHVHQLVFTALDHFPDSLAIQQVGLEVLYLLCKKTKTLLQTSVSYKHIHSFLVKRLDVFKGDQYVQEKCLKILAEFLLLETFRCYLFEKGLQYDLFERVSHALLVFSEAPGVTKAAMEVIKNCICHKAFSPTSVREHFMARVADHVIENIHVGVDTSTQLKLLSLLTGEDDTHVCHLISKDVHLTLMEMCLISLNDVTIICDAMELLETISRDPEVQAIMAANSFVQNGLFTIMDVFKLTGNVQKSGLKMIETLVPQILDMSQSKADETARLIIKAVYTAMSIHVDQAHVQVAGCRTLSIVLEYRPSGHMWIGDSQDQKQDPVHNLVVGALLTYRKEAEVFVAACEAIFWIAADNEPLCTSLMNKNVHVAIIDGLRRHRKLARAVETGCRAIRGLCIFLYDHKVSVVGDGLFSVLTDLQGRYSDDGAVQIEVLSAIACLADVNVVRYQCFIERIPEKIISSMAKFPRESMIQEAGLEAFAVLAGAEGGPEMLLNCGALEATLNTLNNALNNILIVKKGLIVLQLLACPSMVLDDLNRQRVVTVICTALTDYTESKGLLSEACVAIQLLVESDKEISHSFIETDCHHRLFELLDNEFAGVQAVASECLYVLSQEQNLKSAMLLSACKKGTLSATQCLLELGADVNTGADTHTPLCLAVQKAHDDIVRLLLRQGVLDLHTPLNLSLEQGTDVVTGLLLQEIGYDRENGVICWNGLNLRSLEKTWIITAITDRQTVLSETEVGRAYLDKIRSGEERRQKRKLAYSKSDSHLRYPYVRLRHKLVTERTQERNIARLERRLPKTITLSITCSTGSRSRKIAVRSNSFGSPTTHTASGQTALPTILTTSPGEESDPFDGPAFNMSPTEEEEWKEFSISGADVAYHKHDPRQQQSPNAKRINMSGQWKRKTSRPGSVSSDDGSISPSSVQLRRKMSAPVLSNLDHFVIPRCLSMVLGQDIEENVHLEWCRLFYFDASENAIDDLSTFVSEDLREYLTNLETVDLHSNKIRCIPNDIYENLPQLTKVDLSSNDIGEFPVCLLHCKFLKEVRLSRNKITRVGEFGQDTPANHSLRHLDMSRNELDKIPDTFGVAFPKLEELLLNNNKVCTLPPTLNLPSLRTLDLAHNHVERIEHTFLSTCKGIEMIDLSFNRLTQLFDGPDAADLQLLSKVKLRNNRLSEKSAIYIPRFLLELPNLRVLDICENDLNGLPPLLMWKSRTMKDFIASSNNITKLDLKDAKVWSKLEKLHLAKNDIAEIPKEIGYCTCLNSLDISHNVRIRSLPDELGKCSRLYELNITKLELDINKSVLRGRVKDIISYLHNRLKKAQRYYRMKLMVVGYGGRGKTSLLKTLMKIKTNEREDRPTVGVVVKDWVYFKMDRKKSEDNSVWFKGGARKVEYTLSTWDFAGQEDFYSTHSCYLSNRAVYLVVFDLRKGVSEVEKLKSWLVSIRSRAPGCPVIVIGTHLDKLSDESRHGSTLNDVRDVLIEFNQEPGFPTIKKAFYVDASSDDENMEQLRNYIKETVNNLDIRGRRVMGEKIPASYVHLADVLLAKAKSPTCIYPVLDKKDLLKMVNEQDIDLDEDELDQAIRFLHEAGVVLHYDDSTLQLRDYYFIDPGWLCELMARIITVKQINPFISGNGILGKKEIKVLFKDIKEFPAKLIPQYIKLLEKFEIALPHSDKELLIPCRLPIEGPKVALPNHNKYCRLYRLPFAPIGLVFRLIARMISIFSSEDFHSEMFSSEKQLVWRRGVYSFWKEEKYILLAYEPRDGNKMECIQITVPATKQGVKLLCRAVDEIDSLIDEWYPGLTSIDPIKGQPVLEVLTPCTQCIGTDADKHLFSINYLQKAASEDDIVRCPLHGGEVALSELAPDLILGDIEDEFKLEQNAFTFDELPSNQLGDGSFGGVFKGEYKGQTVAVKLFKEIADVHSVKMLRQEATILQSLCHPSVVALLAVGVRPPLIVIEYAAHGTLASLVKEGGEHNKRDIRQLKHKIAMQIAEGLMYIHQCMIVYRDMKPENVLIFSLSLDSTVNAKIADYGIARFTALQGLCAQEGTPGFRAPEVINKENYSFQADIFSFGLTLFVLLTGKHPFQYMDSSMEMDRALSERRQIPPPETHTTHTWPDMQQVIMACLKYDPDTRPTTDNLWDTLRKPEIHGVHKVITVSRSTTVECLAVEEREGKHGLRLWIASGDSESFQLSFSDLSDPSSKTRGVFFNHGRVLCMLSLGYSRLAIGTQLGRVWLFDTTDETYKTLHSSLQMEGSVLCMTYCKRKTNDDTLLVGLANGRIALLPVQELIQEPNRELVCLYPGEDYEPVKCMVRQGTRVYVTCGSQVLVLNTERGFVFDKIIETGERHPSAPAIHSLAVVKSILILSKRSSTVVEVWDMHSEKQSHTVDLVKACGIPNTEARITAMSADQRSIWVGTHGGYICIIDIMTLKMVMVTRRYTQAVRSLEHVNSSGPLKHRAVFSGGLGYVDVFQDTKGFLHGCVLMWDADLPEYAKMLRDYERRRRELSRSSNKFPK
ncbi:LOW QUALITY PROTEIN: leucine-rich repeat serine/threonine-protein kinase 2-like [Mya arenaria]|uniref:LOW QUALITY PROTEIN: leucine-rich repeat serine/threonine-protein kinase 2-like n=1 Tax=Mya arenaria TaxID=6604 RepID=UPI0022E4649B|nr:LOW QUALITY PROTEIN: leucine-rich repeat serine/threonine-protein kinase 2-like [Mya arenaria]